MIVRDLINLFFVTVFILICSIRVFYKNEYGRANRLWKQKTLEIARLT